VKNVAIQAAEVFDQLKSEIGVTAIEARRPTPSQKSVGGLEEQRSTVTGLIGEAPALLAITTRLLEGRRVLAFPEVQVGGAVLAFPEVQTGGAVLPKTAFEAVSGKCFVSLGVEILPHVLAVETRERDEVRPYLVGLRALIEGDQITAARRMLSALPLRFLDDPEISRLRRLLTPPKTRTTPRRDIDRRNDYEWIRRNREAYRGQWVALDEGRLLIAASSLHELREQLKALQLERLPLIHRIQ